MANLYYHRILEGFAESLYTAVSYAAGYSKRSFVCTKAANGDHVLVDPTEGMELSFPELGLLNEQGLGPRPEHVHVPRFDHAREWAWNLRENAELIDQLREQQFAWLLPFTGKSEIVHNLAGELGIPVRSSEQSSAYWAENKQTLVELADLTRIPAGSRVGDKEELIESWKRLAAKLGGPRKAVFKAAQSASGTSSTIIETEQHLHAFMSVFDIGELSGGVIEEWLDSDPRSPSINYFLYPNGEHKVLFISNQLFEDHDIVCGEEGTRIHRGNEGPSDFSQKIHDDIVECTKPLLRALHGNGYWGPVGFDTIVCDGGEVLVTEINPRVTGAHYGWRPMKNLGFSCFSVQNEKVRSDTPFEALREALEDTLYYPGRPGGYVLFNFFPGKFAGVVVGSEPDQVGALRSRVEELLRPLRP
ncbi:ATP-grasp domain-containing protein [Planctomycetota bacterium]